MQTKQRELGKQIVMLSDQVSRAVGEASMPVGDNWSYPKIARFEKERNEQLQKAARDYRRIGKLLHELTAEDLEIVD